MRWWEKRTPEERFWEKVEKTDTCWLWTGCRSSAGYPHFRLKGRQMQSHRLSYEWAVGPIPTGAHLDHLCRVRHCVNPAHLEPVSCRENILRGQGVAAINKQKTHCRNGHPLTHDNLVPHLLRCRERKCLICCRAYQREWQRKRHGYKPRMSHVA